MSNLGRNIALWVVVALVLVVLFNVLQPSGQQGNTSQIAYSSFLAEVNNGQVAKVTITGQDITGTTKDGNSFETYAPEDPNLVSKLVSSGVNVTAKPEDSGNPYVRMLISWLPILVMIGAWIFFMRQMQGGGGRAMGFGKSRARLLTEKQGRVTFEDVAGIDEAKSELQEIVEFLRDPQKFQRLGGKIPKGCLLVGPPGTGKTLLARAIAGEANVPFFTISGSDFVEMFVGVGASRVRDMFEQGKKNAPCIIFIDEIDAVGRHRGAGLGGGHDEREQTLNALLVEMDGFESNEGVILIAATNRPDVLDPALLRPGRFDRRVVVPRPDVRGREEILRVHTRKVPLSEDVDLSVIARGTPGFSGADMANLVNEAALWAARMNRKFVAMVDFEMSKDKVLMGGRAAEEIFLNHITTGAGNDIERATEIARQMVCEWGMSTLGPLTFGRKEEAIFLGREIAQHRDYSEDTAIKIDVEVRGIVNTGYSKARAILESNKDALDRVAKGLLERESLDATELKLLMDGKPLPDKLPPPPAPAVPTREPSMTLRPEPRPLPGLAKGEKPAPA